MANETLIKWRAWTIFALCIVGCPFLLLIAVFYKIFAIYYARTKTPKSVAGDVAVITGGAHGLGKAIAIELAKKGCRIAIVDVNLELAEETAKLIHQEYNVKAKAYKVDVSNYEQVAALNDQLNTDLGTATIVVNNAGILLFSNPLNPNWREVQQMINVNLTAHFWTNHVFLPNMKEAKRGHIVAISSASSYFPLTYNAEYTSTKFAVRGLMRTLRQELKALRYGDIRTTIVFPTFLKTNADVVKIVKKSGYDAFYPLVSGEEAAKRIVDGMLRNEEEIVIPNFNSILYCLIEILPAGLQDWILVAPFLLVMGKENYNKIALKKKPT